MSRTMANVWIFQSNPKYYDLFTELNDPKIIDSAWTVNQHKNKIKKGDIALLWISGKNRGIYAIVDITSDPKMMDLDPDGWVTYDDEETQKLMVEYRYRSKFSQPILESEIITIPGLSDLSIFKNHNRTNFTVTKNQWDIISREIQRGLQEFNEFEYDDDVQSDSWETQFGTVAIKTMDRTSFLYHGSGIPVEIRNFFNINSIIPGKIDPIQLLFKNNIYEAKIRIDRQPNPRTQILWHADFENTIKTVLPKWCEHFSTSHNILPESPKMRFIKTNSPTQYAIEFIEPEKILADISSDQDESEEEKSATEGRMVQFYGKRYERDPDNRLKAIEYHGLQCSICGFDFYKAYGDRGQGFIEIHHIKPISTFEKEKLVDPKSDLVPVCANCHRMIHRKKDNILTIEEMKQIKN